jgi:indole-3-glycerol phosphate synthase
MSILNKILEKKRERLGAARAKTPLKDIRKRAEEAAAAGAARDFTAALTRAPGQSQRVRLIAELKKASPSKGLIRHDFDPRAIARVYAQKNAAAISVLTEEDFFMGDLEYLSAVRKITSCPLLRKDFIFDEYQVYETLSAGADAALLIAAALSRGQAGDLMAISKSLGLAVLFEVHNMKELETAMYLECPVIGINNRSLETLEVDLKTTFELLREIPGGRITVSESGIKTADDVKRLGDAGVHAILVGTRFMESPDIAAAIDELMGLSADIRPL